MQFTQRSYVPLVQHVFHALQIVLRCSLIDPTCCCNHNKYTVPLCRVYIKSLMQSAA